MPIQFVSFEKKIFYIIALILLCALWFGTCPIIELGRKTNMSPEKLLFRIF